MPSPCNARTTVLYPLHVQRLLGGVVQLGGDRHGALPHEGPKGDAKLPNVVVRHAGGVVIVVPHLRSTDTTTGTTKATQARSFSRPEGHLDPPPTGAAQRTSTLSTESRENCVSVNVSFHTGFALLNMVRVRRVGTTWITTRAHARGDSAASHAQHKARMLAHTRGRTKRAAES